MNASDLESLRVSTQPARIWRRPECDRLAEPDRSETGSPATVARVEREPVTFGSPADNFTSAEIRSFQTDDGMASGMIGAILGLAFLVLLALTAGVSVWTQKVAG